MKFNNYRKAAPVQNRKRPTTTKIRSHRDRGHGFKSHLWLGASGPTVIQNGKFMPVSYLLEWKNDRFEMKEFSFDGAFWKVNL